MIEARSHQVMQAMLRQQQPEAFIDAVETRQAQDPYQVSWRFYGGGSSASLLIDLAVRFATGCTGAVVVVNTERSTGSLFMPSMI